MFYALVCAVLAVVGIDYATGLQVPFTSAYMALIFYASHKMRPMPTYGIALVCLGGTFLIDILLLDPGTTLFSWVLLWRLLINSLSFLGTALLCNSWNTVRKTLQQSSDRDFLTGLSNRRHFTREVEREVDIHSRNLQPFAIALMDVDNFKIINDTLGHNRGDEILVEVARALGRETRSFDLVCRYGGDEFIIFMREVGLEQAREIMQRIQHSLNQTVRRAHTDLSFSTGVISFTLDQRISVETLVGMVDRELYRVKKQDKNGISAVRYDLSAQTTPATRSGQQPLGLERHRGKIAA